MSTQWSERTSAVVHAWIASTIVGVSMLAACSDGGGPGRPPEPPPPPPVAALPEIVLGVIAFDVGGSRVVLRGGQDVQVVGATAITANGRAADFDELRPGRVVLVRRDLPGGAPSRIDAYDLLVGPLDSVDPATARLVVMGQRVVVNGHTVIGLSAVQDGALATLQAGSTVAVSGHVTATGEVLATRVDIVADDGLLVRGLVRSTDPASGRLTIGDVDVDYAQAAWDAGDFFPAGVPLVGDEVVVRAPTGPTAGVLAAESMEYVPRRVDAPAGTRVTLDGVITRALTNEFEVAGRLVHLLCNHPLACDEVTWNLLVENAEVRFSGGLMGDGSLLGDLVAEETMSRSLSVTGPVVAIDPATGAVMLPGFRVQPSGLTGWIDENAPVPGMSATDLRIGDTVDASGTHGGSPGLLLASLVRRVPPASSGIRGWQFVRDEPEIVMLGRSILTDGATAVDVCGAAVDAATLFSMSAYSIEELEIGLSAADPERLRATRATINDGNCW